MVSKLPVLILVIFVAPVPAIDICLHALQALDNAVLDQFQDAFHLLFTSLTQQSDLAHHPHMLIQIAFLEFSLRHFKRLNEATLLAMAFSIVHRIQSFVLLSSQPSTRRGSASIVPSKQVAIKLTNLALKIVDVYPEKWKLLLVMAPITKGRLAALKPLIVLFVFLLFSLYFYNIAFLPSIERCI